VSSKCSVVPDLLSAGGERLAPLQLLEVEGQRQHQVAEVLAGEGEGVVGRRRHLGRWGSYGRGRSRGLRWGGTGGWGQGGGERGQGGGERGQGGGERRQGGVEQGQGGGEQGQGGGEGGQQRVCGALGRGPASGDGLEAHGAEAGL